MSKVYMFDSQTRELSKELLGGKGANLAEMSRLGLPVPPGFTISVKGFHEFYENKGILTESLKKEIRDSLFQIEKKVNKKFGDTKNPLLVSVRSGAAISMPGMMDTILNLGLNDETVEGLAHQSEDEAFAWDSYRRFLQTYSQVVMGMNLSFLEVLLEDMKEKNGYKEDHELKVGDLKVLVGKFKDRIFDHTQKTFPKDPEEQLWEAVGSVFQSWYTSRAKTYRKLHSISDSLGTAVNIQAMVFGNLGVRSATGVCFTRNPSTGEKKLFGEFLPQAQGEDVVSGVRTPLALSGEGESFEALFPEAHKKLLDTCHLLENHFSDMQDIEFTVERGKFWLLQTRNAKRTAQASLKVACDLLDEKKISEKEALLRIDPLSLNQLLHPVLDPRMKKNLLTKGLPASPGGVTGQIFFTSSKAQEETQKGKKVILVRQETSPEDIEGMIHSQGILTIKGGMTSHAAVVARGLGKCCVVGCHELQYDKVAKTLSTSSITFKEGDYISLDGMTGEVFQGEIASLQPVLGEEFHRIMKLSEKNSLLDVRVNADNKTEVNLGFSWGAHGVGLCRTEHMFFSADRILNVRKMILAQDESERKDALEKLFVVQKKDFKEIFEACEGKPVNVRLLDPPLHEFLPQKEDEKKELSKSLNWTEQRLENQIVALHETNPMLGHRGCRLGLTFPSIYEMQASAMAEACVELLKKNLKVNLEVMVPLVMMKEELQKLKSLVIRVFTSYETKHNLKIPYKVGTMIELPRACLKADELALEADFFSFGTNDLTQTCLGLSRDDSGKFLPHYLSQGLLKEDPFVSLDREGVGELLTLAVNKGRKSKSSLKIGICGEHGGDPLSISFFHNLGLDYVSCSAYRVPIARLAAAQAHLKTGG